MKRPANAVRLACGHPMCDPGSPECRARDTQPGKLRRSKIRTGVDPEWAGGAELHRSDCETNSYDCGPCDCGTSGVTAEVLDQLVDDARADLAHAIATARPLATIELITRHWRRTRPGFARLLDLTDQD